MILNAISGYERSDPFRNGEYQFLKNYIKSNMLVIDVGANVGDYAKYLLSINPNIEIHCFEPVLKTFNKLIENLSDEIDSGRVFANNAGLSDKENESEIYIYEDYSGNNSLHFYEINVVSTQLLKTEKVALTTLDNYVKANNIKDIDFLKVDVEGHEVSVLYGASELIECRKIKRIQFEYNSNWTVSGSKLEDLYSYLSNFGYKFFRLTIWGKIPIRKFRKKLENFRHSNYLAVIDE